MSRADRDGALPAHGTTESVPDLRIVSSGATAQDVAAVTAVVRGALAQLSADLDGKTPSGVSAWQRSQRPIRGTITPGAGAWRSF
ncbi:hypothetical protein BH11ACT4_BH11ACT4_01770 [soil metagenome]